ncbi:hypothetical protein P5704_024390 (plasmid) [Pseudomonas sp. FeN3W]|nr:hypothetical protein P5704_024390 [Pseudomonas sp. FeN3W]
MNPINIFESECPSDWMRVRAQHVFSNVSERRTEDDVQLSSSQKYGVLPQSLLMEMEGVKYALAHTGINGFKKILCKDFLISLRSFEGGFEMSSYDGCVSPAYTVLRPNSAICHEYWKYVFKSNLFIGMLGAYNIGIRDGKSVRYDDFANCILAIPNLSLQNKIAKYITQETARIDTLIEKSNNLIKLLKEKRQAVITEAVTKGLNPNVPMKDSGIEWMGEVPEHWVIKRIKWEAKAYSGKDNKSLQGVYPLYGANGVIGFSDRASMRSPGVLIGRVGSAGSITFIDEASGVSDNALIYSNKSFTAPRFDYYLLQSINFEMDISRNAQPLITATDIQEKIVCVPIDLAERISIATYLDSFTLRIDSLLEKSLKLINLLKEKRQSIITEAVTGKIDLR